ncbi:hypothetical protein [Staphylococcus simulans]|uniref:hypothetical protein n=1 Tax=Staphylococcus simulans TaxID=1286 RepID=UPI000D1DDC9F|nr:hypothetical protein [Staphylococcus simulans]MDY5059279.1 hypothetical protein [Staphylococcus simulans]PTJ20576.1 hypothetical protein BU038_01480 [Staphylococcus simulans]RIN78952.1 hypothetical protein BU015_02215 [Staphylococcus simulans]
MTTGSIITYSIVGLLLIAAMIILFIETKKPKQVRSQKMTIIALLLTTVSTLIIFIFSLIQSLS